MTMSVATSNLLSDMNADDITLDDLKKTVASLDDAANSLQTELYLYRMEHSS